MNTWAGVSELLIFLQDKSVSTVAVVNGDILQTWLCTIKLYHILKFKGELQYAILVFLLEL